MAAEISFQVRLNGTKDRLTFDTGSLTGTADMASARTHESVQAIGFAAHEAIVINTDIATIGYAVIKNMDATNYVEVGLVVAATFYPFSKLLPSEVGLLPLAPSVTYYAKANVASVDLFVKVTSR